MAARERTADFLAAASSASSVAGSTARPARRRARGAAEAEQAFLAAGEGVAAHVAAVSRAVADVKTRYARAAAPAARDALEAEVAQAVAHAQEGLSELSAAASRLPPSQFAAHAQGVALALAERLAASAAAFDALRDARARRELDAKRRRRAAAAAAASRPAARAQQQQQQQQQPTPPLTAEAAVESGVAPAQAQAVAQEASTLVHELEAVVDAVREAEGRVAEMSALNSAFASHVQQQAHQIEALYHDALKQTGNFERGNVELQKTIDRNAATRVYVFAILIVAALMLLFADWFQG